MINGGSIPETRCEVSIWGLWERQTEVINVVRFGYDDAETRNPEIMDKLLSWWGKIKKEKHGQHFHDQQKYVSR